VGNEVEHADGAYNVEGLDRYNDANYLLRLLVRSSIGSNNRIRGRKGTCRQVREDKDKKKKGTKNNDKTKTKAHQKQ
jgi:hypothetical protein